MQLEIITPDKAVFKGEAQSVTLPGVDGSFQILSNHAPMISALGKGTMTIQSTEGMQSYNMDGGTVEVLNNSVIVLAEQADKIEVEA